MGKQPGVMLYFDVRDSIRALTQAEKGDLFDAILDYGQNHTEPDFDNTHLALIWPFVRKDIHRDAQRYEARRQAGILGAQRRWIAAAEAETEMADDSKPMANDGKPMANDGKPMANDGKPMANDGKPMANDGKPMANDGKPMAKMPSTSTSSSTSSPASSTAAAAAPPKPAAAAETNTAPEGGNTAPAPLREKGTHLPDCVAKYVPRKAASLSPEEFAMRKQEWLSILRARPDDA